MVKALINLGSEVNMINQDFAKKLGFRVYEGKVCTQKINSSELNTFGMVIASFLIEDKDRKYRFYEEIFLLADISINIALLMPFFTLSNIEIDFVDCHIH